MKNLLIIDLESTCFERGSEPTGFKSEIIEIGAVVFNPNTQTVIEDYQCFIKPALFPILSEFCKELTTITQHQVDNGLTLQQAICEIGELQKKFNAVFVSWGYYDKKQFENVCRNACIPYPFDDLHISIKHNHGEFYSKKPMGMGSALKFHQLSLEGTHHRGIDDARNIANITAKLIQDGWKHNALN